jgi:hypothetical protein
MPGAVTLCPRCGDDISDTYQVDEPDVGIVGGWWCEACDVGLTETDADID